MMLQFSKFVLRERPQLLLIFNPGYSNGSVGINSEVLWSKIVIRYRRLVLCAFQNHW